MTGVPPRVGSDATPVWSSIWVTFLVVSWSSAGCGPCAGPLLQSIGLVSLSAVATNGGGWDDMWDGVACSRTHIVAARHANRRQITAPAILGAKLGANRCGSVWTAVDTYGHGSLSFRGVWTAVGCHGRSLEIYGSEDWGFESLRACHVNPCTARVSLRSAYSSCRLAPRFLGGFLVDARACRSASRLLSGVFMIQKGFDRPIGTPVRARRGAGSANHRQTDRHKPPARPGPPAAPSGCGCCLLTCSYGNPLSRWRCGFGDWRRHR
jgi:hypothetical protein